jgi:GT2 family glycosyltransferase
MAQYPIIKAAVVNHNTSAYCELMLRSLFAMHPDLPGFSLEVFDNGSTDDTSGLRAAAGRLGVPLTPSGYTLDTLNNSHGDVLRSFVLANPDCDYFLFLDADVVFVQPDTIPAMLRELETQPDAFGAGPRMSWDGQTPYAGLDGNPEVYAARLHPCCALIRNTPLFRRVVAEVGLFCVKFLWAEREEYLDTFKLMTKVMKTHGLRHLITRQIVIHFFCVSYEWDAEEARNAKLAWRDELLAKHRQHAA